MEFKDKFPIWNKLTKKQQEKLDKTVTNRNVKKGTIIHNGSMTCVGLILVESGQFRSYIYSEEGREITIYRLFEMDICIFSASCVMQNIQFDITIEAEKDSVVWIIPPNVLKEIMEESAPMANYMNQIMAGTAEALKEIMENENASPFTILSQLTLLDVCIQDHKLLLKSNFLYNILTMAKKEMTLIWKRYTCRSFIEYSKK